MNTTDLLQLKSLLGDWRFVQAASLAATRLVDSKEARDYMKNLARLEKVIDAEIKEQT